MRLTPAETERARNMFREGHTWAALGTHFGCSPETVRRAMDPEWAERRKRGTNEARRIRIDTGQSAVTRRVTAKRAMQERVFVDYDPTPNQFILGDPAPGRSALDRLREGSDA